MSSFSFDESRSIRFEADPETFGKLERSVSAYNRQHLKPGSGRGMAISRDGSKAVLFYMDPLDLFAFGQFFTIHQNQLLLL